MSALTKVEDCKAIHALRALVRTLLPSLSWRHHGIGALQAYVTEGAGVETRVHIWDPRLIKPGMAESGSIHDHRFDMVSHVLVGAVGHEEWFTYPDAYGDHATLTVTHARAAAGTKFHGPISHDPTGQRYRASCNPIFIPAGHTYRFPALSFHRSPVPAFAVTVVEKHNQRGVPARVLHPIDRPPVMAFGHEMDAALAAELVQQAIKGLA